jgi:hypothetical protein
VGSTSRPVLGFVSAHANYFTRGVALLIGRLILTLEIHDFLNRAGIFLFRVTHQSG